MPDPDERIVYADPVWGPWTFHGLEAKLFRSAELTRLRNIKQLSTVYIIHPNAIHTRFQHSVGVACLVKFFLNSLPTEFIERYVDFQDMKLLFCAALLHDIGHSAWSHVGELLPRYFKGMPSVSHDKLSAELVMGATQYDEYFRQWDIPRVRDIITDDDERQKIANMIQGIEPRTSRMDNKETETVAREKKWMASMIEGPIDFDTADFLRRDTFYTLANAGLVDPCSLARGVGIELSGDVRELVFLNVPFGESFMCAQEFMYPSVYIESKNLATEELLLRALRRTYSPETIYDFWFSTDDVVLDHIGKSSDKVARRISQYICSQRPCDVAAEIPLSTVDQKTQQNAKELYDKRYGLLDLEQDIVQEARKRGVNVQDGNVVVSVWVWNTRKIPLAQVIVKEGCKQLVTESSLINTLSSSAYPLTRSKFVIGTIDIDAADEKRAIADIALDLLRTEKYPREP